MLASSQALSKRVAAIALQTVTHFSNLAPLSYNSTELSYNQFSSNNFQNLCKKGQLHEAFSHLLCMCPPPPSQAYIALLKVCISRKSLSITFLIYTHLALHVSDFTGFLGDYLVVTLAKCGAIDDAYCTSCALPCRTVFSWTAIISACADRGRVHDALKMHQLMLDDGVEPNEFTFASLFKACGIKQDLQAGKHLHEEARKKGFTSIEFVGNTLVSMYGKCGAVADAVNVFTSLPQQSVISWNAMLSAYVEQGEGEKVLQLYRTMLEMHVVPDQLSYVSALQACGIVIEKDKEFDVRGRSTEAVCLEILHALHSSSRKMGLLTNVFVGTTLVTMYGKFGTLEEAECVFIAMSERNNVSWNAMLLSYIEQGKGLKALQFYRLMQEEGMNPDQHTLATALKACYTLVDEEEAVHEEGICLQGVCLEIGNAIYCDAQKMGLASDSYVGTALLSVYGKCGAMIEAEKLLATLTYRNVVSWTAMLSAYLVGCQAGKALQAYIYMQEEGVEADQQALVLAIQACGFLDKKQVAIAGDAKCARLTFLEIGRGLHAEARRRGFSSDNFVGSTLVSMYGKFGSIGEAEYVFCRLLQYNVVTWTAMLSAYVEQGQGEKALRLYKHMQEQGVSPDEQTLLIALQACGTLAEKETYIELNKKIPLKLVQALHEDAWRKGYASDNFIVSTLLIVYGKCGSITDAENVFTRSLQQGVVSWSAMASTLVQQGEEERALQLYRHMQKELLSPDQRMLAIALQACGTLELATSVGKNSPSCMPLEVGRALHAEAYRKDFVRDAEVGKALVSLYGKFGTIMEAEHVFMTLPKGDMSSWKSMLSAYVDQGQGGKALQFYRYMQEEGLDPDAASLVIALQACGMLEESTESSPVQENFYKTASLEIVQALHADAQRSGFTSDVFAGNTILKMYGECGTIMKAEEVFSALPHCGVSSWNAMLSAYLNQGQEEKALDLFRQMEKEDVTPDEITHMCVLQACSETGNSRICQQLHFAISAAGHDINLSLAATLIHAYGSCACTLDGQAVFDGLALPHLAAWTACITGHAGEGHSVASLLTFEESQHMGIVLDGTMFTSVFGACSHAGLVVDGLELFGSMSRDYGISLDSMHYGSMVDLLGRAGNFKKLENLLWRMPMQPDHSIWSSLLGACRAHGNLELGKQAFQKAIHDQPKEGSTYVVMSNIFAYGLDK